MIVADAGMLSAANLKALDAAGLRFIVGSRETQAPVDLAGHFAWHGDAFTDGQIIDTITPRHSGSRRDTTRAPNLSGTPRTTRWTGARSGPTRPDAPCATGAL